MLPFLKHKKEASISAPVEVIKREHDEGSDFDVMESAAEDLMHAVHAKDIKAIAMALRSAFELCQSDTQEDI